MHKYSVPQSVEDSVVNRMGKLFAHDTIDPAHLALVVIDCRTTSAPRAFRSKRWIRIDRPNTNRMASVVRAAGATVVWVQTSAAGALEHWANFHNRMLRPSASSSGWLDSTKPPKASAFPPLEVLANDLRVGKMKYSAMAPGSSDLDGRLRACGIDTVLIAGAATNVCCESTARDAMLIDYKVIMLSDATATWTDEDHAASLNTFMRFFGDVMTVAEAIARLPTPQ